MAVWLVAHGADLQATDIYDYTPLQERSYSGAFGNIESLISLGAEVNFFTKNGTDLHCAAKNINPESAKILIEHGADVNVVTDGYYKEYEAYTPLEIALYSCQNTDIPRCCEFAEILLKAGANKTERMRTFVTKIGEGFEEFRSVFGKEALEVVVFVIFLRRKTLEGGWLTQKCVFFTSY